MSGIIMVTSSLSACRETAKNAGYIVLDAAASYATPRPAKRKLPMYDVTHNPYVVPTKRFSPFLNTPKERRDERRKVLKMAATKLRSIDDPEKCLRRSVLVNNQFKRLRCELLDEKKYGYGICGSVVNATQQEAKSLTPMERPITPEELSSQELPQTRSSSLPSDKVDEANNYLPYRAGEPTEEGACTSCRPTEEYVCTSCKPTEEEVDVVGDTTDDISDNNAKTVSLPDTWTDEGMDTNQNALVAAGPSHMTSDLYTVPDIHVVPDCHAVSDCHVSPDCYDFTPFQVAPECQIAPVCHKPFMTCRQEDTSSQSANSSTDNLTDKDRQILSEMDVMFNKLINVLSEVVATC